MLDVVFFDCINLSFCFIFVFLGFFFFFVKCFIMSLPGDLLESTLFFIY